MFFLYDLLNGLRCFEKSEAADSSKRSHRTSALLYTWVLCFLSRMGGSGSLQINYDILYPVLMNRSRGTMHHTLSLSPRVSSSPSLLYFFLLLILTPYPLPPPSLPSFCYTIFSKHFFLSRQSSSSASIYQLYTFFSVYFPWLFL